MSKREIVGIDIIRFLCALSVVFVHFVPRLPISDNWAAFGGPAVNIFFVISGFIIPQSSVGRSPSSFIKSRIIRLVPAMWVCATITLIVFLLSGNTEDLWGRYLRSIFFIPGTLHQTNNLDEIWMDGVYWTLFVEISFYCMVLGLLLFNAFHHIGKFATIISSICLIYWSLLLGLHAIAPDSHLSQIVLDTAFKRYFDLSLVHFGAWFGLGINIWLASKGQWRIPPILICLLAGALENFNNATHYNHPVMPSQLYCLAGLSLIALSVFSNHQYSEHTRRICRLVGLTTYPLYLIHDKAGLILIDFLGGGGIGQVASAITSAFISVMLAFCVARFIEPVIQNSLKAVMDHLQSER